MEIGRQINLPYADSLEQGCVSSGPSKLTSSCS